MTTHDGYRFGDGRLTRRWLVATTAAVAGGALAPVTFARQAATPVTGASTDEIMAIARGIMTECDLRAVILHVTVDGEEMMTEALGESMTGSRPPPKCASGMERSPSRSWQR